MYATINGGNTAPGMLEDPHVASEAVVMEALATEWEYQDHMWGQNLSGDRPLPEGLPPGFRTLDEWVLYMSGYMADLVKSASHSSSKIEHLNIIRKITTMGFRAMRQHGAPLRTF